MTLEDPGMALARAVAPVLREIRDTIEFRTPEELPAGECSVKVAGEWFGYAGLDSRGRMVLWPEGAGGPSFYPPSEAESFPWRPLIGGAS